MAELPKISNNDPSNFNQKNQEINNKIIWQDSDDVYKPIPKNITEFLEERNIPIEHKKVYIKEEAFETIKSHLKTNLRVEQGGILFGNAYQDETLGIYVEINVAVPAPATIGSGAHLEFTSDSWMKIMDFARREHPDENIVGWYHSHPNLGVFMSGTDMRTQQAFFYHPWCLSIVHDPVRQDTGFFLGKNATKITPYFYSNLPTFSKSFSNDETSETENGGEINDENSVNPFKKKKKKKTQKFKEVLLIVLFIILLFGLLSLPKLISVINSLNIGQNEPETPEKIAIETVATIPQPPAFKAEIRTLSKEQLTAMTKFSNNQEIPEDLRYSVINQENIGKGENITALLITPTVEKQVKNITLNYQKFPLNSKSQPLEIQNNDLFNLSDKLEKLSLGEDQKKNLNQRLTIGEGILFVMFSSSPQENSISEEIKGNIYLPLNLSFSDVKNNFTNLQVKDIVLEPKHIF